MDKKKIVYDKIDEYQNVSFTHIIELSALIYTFMYLPFRNIP